MVAVGQKALRAMLPRDIHKAIWRRLALRLEHGEVLITTGDYMRVLQSEYAALTGAPATPNVVGVLRQTIEAYNHRHPEAYVARGVVNCVSKAFRTGAPSPGMGPDQGSVGRPPQHRPVYTPGTGQVLPGRRPSFDRPHRPSRVYSRRVGGYVTEIDAPRTRYIVTRHSER